ncbi:hypothetical protein LTR62_005791 [Meristemomyces frigidus]|uniref:Ubiquitin-like domain-containing protein n=1 Tax=Meristemomyces frigidus TaxID=1508187 RepID=A0AAN7YQ89_9PEZI|nr:hypothetical protein LTR62_005791 [Meristemomyces frigidus]
MPSAAPPTTITLKVKVPPGYTSDGADEFPLGSLEVNTNIGAVRQQIQSTIPSHPAPDQQRILYGGRALVDNEQTLADALNTKRDPTQSEYVVHLLVKGESGAGSGAGAGASNGVGHRRTGSAPPSSPQQPQQGQQHDHQQMNAQAQAQHHQLHQQNLARQMHQQMMMQQQMGTGQGMIPGMPFPGMQIPGMAPHMGLPMPPGFAQAVAHNQQHRAGMGMHGVASTPTQQGSDGQTEQPTLASSGQTQNQPQQSQQQGNGTQQPGTNTQSPHPAPGHPHHHHYHHNRPLSGQGFHFQGIGPNGQQIQIHQQTIQFPGQAFPPPMPHFDQALPHAFATQPRQPAQPRNPTPAGPSALERARENLTEMRTMLEQMRASMRNDEQTPESLIEQASRLEELEGRVSAVRQYVDPFGVDGGPDGGSSGAGGLSGLPARPESLFGTGQAQFPGPSANGQQGTDGQPPLQGLFGRQQPRPGAGLFGPQTGQGGNLFGNNAQAGQGGSLFGNNNARGGGLFGNGGGQSGSLFGISPQTPLFGPQNRSIFAPHQPIPPGPTDTTCYLLSGPQGPQALLFSPQHGAYTGSTPLPLASAHSPMPRVPLHQQAQYQNVMGNATVMQQGQNGQRQQQQALAAAADQPNQPAAPANAPANAANPVAAQQQPEPLAPFAPLMNHMWLLFRVLIFAYFIMGSNLGWKRPLALLMIGLGFWMIRAGLLGGEGAMGGIGAAVRGWWEGVLGGAQAQGRPQPAEGAAPAAHGALAGGMPTPEQLAQRLLNQRQGQNHAGRFRELIRPVERAVALFVASLWPGIGEAHVRAREDAERRARDEVEVAERRAADEREVGEEARRIGEAEEEGEKAAVEDAGEKTEPAGEVGSASNMRDTKEAGTSAKAVAESARASVAGKL